MIKSYIQPKMVDINSKVSHKRIIVKEIKNGFRARSESLTDIPNVKTTRPEAFSKISAEEALNKLIPKIEYALKGTNKKLGKIFHISNGYVYYELDNILYDKPKAYSNNNISLEDALITFIKNNLKVKATSNEDYSDEKFTTVAGLWVKETFERTTLKPDEENFLAITSFKGYKEIYDKAILPFFQVNKNFDKISLIDENLIDNLLKTVNGKNFKRKVLIVLKLIMKFAQQQKYISQNPILNKKSKRTKSTKNDKLKYIEENRRSVWISNMINEMKNKSNDAPLAFLCMLLHRKQT